jgi:hypothetical protein
VNNSLPRLIDGMVQTLQKEIIPHIEGDYARGQAYGVIYMLNSIKLRASWSCGFLLEQLRALDEAKHSVRQRWRQRHRRSSRTPQFWSPPAITATRSCATS